jgi:hypothetical protein
MRQVAAPDGVASLAARRGFGNLIDIRREVTMMEAVIKGGIVTAVSLGLMILLGWLGGDTSVFSPARSVLRFFAFAAFIMFVWGLAYAIRGLVVGSRVHYLYEGGLVHSRRSGLRAVAWPEVTVLKSVYNRRRQGDEGKVLGYRVETQGGSSFAIPLSMVNGRDPFIDWIVERLRAHGRPIQ